MSTSYSIDPDALEPTIELSLSQQKRVLIFLDHLDKFDHYEVLGVPREAEKGVIRAAYFKLINEFHADRYYGKNLGGFAVRMRTIVEALTRANDVLTRKSTRADYDALLLRREGSSRVEGAGYRASTPQASSARTKDNSKIEPVRSSEPRNLGEEQLISPQIPAASPAPRNLEQALRPPGTAVVSKPGAIPATDPLKSCSSSFASGRALSKAEKLRLAKRMGRLSPPPPSNGDPSSARIAVAKDLKSRYEAKKRAEKSSVNKFVTLSEEAQAAGDWASAVNAIRLALDLAPDDPEIIKKTHVVQSQADKILAPRFLEQAKSEEKDARYERAARSYERAARGTNSAELFAKSACCLLQVGHLENNDGRKLVEMARLAVSLDNDNAAYRLTLAKAYDVAGMRSSALGEIGRALRLEPDNNDAKQLQKSLK